MSLLDTAASTTSATDHDATEWVEVCAIDDLVADRGVCALVAGHPVAVFRCRPDDELFALSNIDPFSNASVLSRGIVGSIGDRPVVASPIDKNRFDLRTGESLDESEARLARYSIRCVEGRIEVSSLAISDEMVQHVVRA